MIKSYLKDTVSIVAATEDKWGNPETPVVTEVKARVIKKQRLVRSPEGETVVSGTQVWLASEPTATDQIRIASVDYPIITISEQRDFKTAYWEVFL